ncbi:MAG TPA: pseudouridine synthase [Lachnospiraceae bacterium]|nr:pseudouridine synthase [Butyrivibrio sp. CAG:318]HJI31565.1 pseudouridine synthase [Lachnospiraceae bacterium]
MDNNEQSIRINKYISASGYCSRREADRLIEAGRVRIDGVVAVTGSRVNPKMTVTVDDTELNMAEDRVVYALNKPAGYISSLSDEQGQGISCFIPDGMRLFPVGRLDKESEGLMLLTNDGELMNNLLNAAGGHEKEYYVTVDRKVTDIFLKALESGVKINNRATGAKVITAPCRTRRISDNTFSIILIQGLNRQIRRMCGALGYGVVRLRRMRIKNICLGDLNEGCIRKLSDEEIIGLNK